MIMIIMWLCQQQQKVPLQLWIRSLNCQTILKTRSSDSDHSCVVMMLICVIFEENENVKKHRSNCNCNCQSRVWMVANRELNNNYNLQDHDQHVRHEPDWNDRHERVWEALCLHPAVEGHVRKLWQRQVRWSWSWWSCCCWWRVGHLLAHIQERKAMFDNFDTRDHNISSITDDQKLFT